MNFGFKSCRRSPQNAVVCPHVDLRHNDSQEIHASEMFSLVWSAPMRSVAAELGLSDVGLKKAVRKAGIPTPPQEYRNRVAAGRKFEPRPTLPPRGIGASDDIWIGGNYWQHHEPPPGPNDPAPIAPTFDESMESVRKRVEKAVGKVARARSFDATSRDRPGHPGRGRSRGENADGALAVVLGCAAVRFAARPETPAPPECDLLRRRKGRREGVSCGARKSQ